MENNGRQRVVIENVTPEIDGGRFAIKRSVGETVAVTADIFTDGHDRIAACLAFKKLSDTVWTEIPMRYLSNDTWEGEFVVRDIGMHGYTVRGWVDHFGTWRDDLKKKFGAGQDIAVDIATGAELVEEAAKRAVREDVSRLKEYCLKLKNAPGFQEAVTLASEQLLTEIMDRYPEREIISQYEKTLDLVVDRKMALFSAWYERFPRSCSAEPGSHGTFKDCQALLPEIARMGFDVLYLPPVHPIGRTKRKGKNNAPVAEVGDVGSPWAIGAAEGGHKAIHPDLGTLQDFREMVKAARELGIEIAMDIAVQCAPDHPYVKEHPEWFKWRPDGTVQYAENPPKKYEDIIPIHFETEEWTELWDELKSIFLFWIEKGVSIFRVDNPHTKPFPFWEWLITGIRREHPDVIFLAEAFTRPKVMYRLAKIGFSQSYTYFTWRNTKREITDYMLELVKTDVREYMRPNFWTNTPDILPEHLQYGGRPGYLIRLVLAATLSSNYGIYGPAFELFVQDAIEGKEEYLHSEKYEIKYWDWDMPGNLKDFMERINMIRKENPALQDTWNVRFFDVDNDYIMGYGKATDDLSNIIIVIVNLNPYHKQAGWITVPIEDLGIVADQPYLVHDLLSENKYIWHGERNYIELNPEQVPAHIFRVRKRLKREMDFDYFM